RVMSVVGQHAGKARAAAALLLTLPGVPYLYYGEEIGMVGPKPDELIRRPMQWASGPGVGFTTGTPWIAPGPNAATHNVAAETGDPGSLLSWYRSLVRVRTERPSLRRGHYHAVTSPRPAVFSFLRSHGDERVLVVVNTSGTAQSGLRLGLPPGLVSPGAYELGDLLAPGQTAHLTVDGASGIEGVSVPAYGAQAYVFTVPVGSGAPAGPAGRLTLEQNRPNPALGSAVIAFGVPEGGPVTLEVFNALGQRVWALVDAEYAAGQHAIEVDTRGLAAGVYAYRLRQGDRGATRRMTVLR
ncbi:MAG TPA: alpha-amylase family glycosyl hydrolase, partial [Rubricoccaceae bacterium]